MVGTPLRRKLGIAATFVLALGLVVNLVIVGLDTFAYPTARTLFGFVGLCALALVAAFLLWRLVRIFAGR